MEVILLETVANLGGIGDRVVVKDGYARNYLIPQGKVVLANQDNIEFFESKRQALEAAEAELVAAAKIRADSIAKMDLKITVNTSEDGQLYGALTERDVLKLFESLGESFHPHDIYLVDGPIRSLGEFPITVRCHTNVVVPMTVRIEAE